MENLRLQDSGTSIFFCEPKTFCHFKMQDQDPEFIALQKSQDPKIWRTV